MEKAKLDNITLDEEDAKLFKLQGGFPYGFPKFRIIKND
jgi:hypothetical protein